jgi:hypothetical protein
MLLKNAVFWDVAPCGFNINKGFRETCLLHLQSRRNNTYEESVRRMLTDWLLFHSENLGGAVGMGRVLFLLP